MNNKRIIGLDAAKVFACILVVFMHTLRRVDATVPYHPFLYYFTRCSMPLFFMCPGFIQINKKSVDFKYCINKIKNIIIVALVWCFIFYFVFAALEQSFSFRSFCSAMIGWTMAHGRFSVFWYLREIAFFYLLLIPIRRIFSTDKGAIIFTGSLFLFCAAIDVTKFIYIMNGIKHLPLSFVKAPFTQLWSYLLYFCIGGLIGKLKLHEKIKLIPLAVSTVLSGIAAVLYMYYLVYYKTNIINGGVMYESILLIIFSSLLFCLFLRIKTENKYIVNTISFLGSMLMAVYALHYSVIMYLLSFYSFHTPVMEIVLGIIVYVICLGVGVIISRIPYLKRIMTL